MKIVIALDSFKGSLDALPACEAAKRGILSVLPDADVVCKPMADGGEGTATALIESEQGEWVPCRVTGPLFNMQVDAGYAWFPETREALVEMAVASGLPLLSENQRNPMETTTFGTGELIRAAVEKGAEKIRLAVGGSATCDGGMGAAEALGFQFLPRSLGVPAEKNGFNLPGIGKNLSKVWKIVIPADLQLPAMEVLCDVTNPLTGPNGAAAVYGPQKGATPEMVAELDSGLRNFAAKIFQCLEVSVENLPGAGAAGGLAAGAVAFMGATVVPGVDSVMAAHRLEDALTGADWVVTGEGRFDSQSLQGKVVDGICRMAKATDTRIAVLAGSVGLEEPVWRAAGIEWVAALKAPGMKLEEAICRASELVQERAAELAGNFR